MKKSLLLLVFLLFSLSLFSQGNSEISFFGEKSHYAFITDSQNSEIVTKGATLSTKENYPNLQVDVLYINNNIESEALVLSAISNNYDAVFSIGDTNTILRNLSREYIEKRFVTLSPYASSYSLFNNYTDYFIDLYFSSFLCGIASSSLSGRGKVGVIAREEYKDAASGFIKGIEEVSPGTEIDIFYISSDTENDVVSAISDTIYKCGAGLIFTLIGEKYPVVLEKAKEWGEYIIVGDTYLSSDESLLLSVDIDYAKAISLIIEKTKDEKENTSCIPLGLGDGVVNLSWFIDENEINRLDENMKKKAVGIKSTLRRYINEINGPQ